MRLRLAASEDSPLERRYFLSYKYSIYISSLPLQLQSECVELFVWIVSELHRGVSGNPAQKSIIFSSLQGRLEMITQTRVYRNGEESWDETVSEVPFMYLGLDIPPAPLFKDSQGGMVIAQVPLFELLRKYDGVTWSEAVVAGNVVRKKYRLLRLPPYLVFHLNRFTKNNFFEEKNPTIVTFPVKNLELKDYVSVDEGTKYDLVSSICHDSTGGSGISEMTTTVTSDDK